jgi:hypothetical protein
VLLAVRFALAATPIAGIEWRPLGRADLSWVDEARTSGVSVGEFDGTVRPSLMAYGGTWLGSHVCMTGAVGVARLGNLTTADNITTQRWWMVVRPSVDLRVALTERRLRSPVPYLLGGLHFDIPSVGDRSEAYTKKEQAAVDDAVLVEVARLAGAGGRLGAGADYRVVEGVAVGLLYAVEAHRAFWQADEVGFTTTWMAGEASITLQFEWPRALP